MLAPYVDKVLGLRGMFPHLAMAVKEYAAVYFIAEMVKPIRILEAGTGYGFSTRVMHEACPTTNIDSIDLLTGDMTKEEWGKFVHGIPNVHLIRGDSRSLIPKLTKENNYGLALLDNGHDEETVLKNVEDCKRIPVVIVHNGFKGGVTKALERSGQPFKLYWFNPVDEPDKRYIESRSMGGVGLHIRGFELESQCLEVVRRNKSRILQNLETYLRHKGLIAREIFLFHSRATGECKPNSDIDIYIQLDERHRQLVEEHATLWGNRRDLHWNEELKAMGLTTVETWKDPHGNVWPIALEVCFGVEPTPPYNPKKYEGRKYYMRFSEV